MALYKKNPLNKTFGGKFDKELMGLAAGAKEEVCRPSDWNDYLKWCVKEEFGIKTNDLDSARAILIARHPEVYSAPEKPKSA